MNGAWLHLLVNHVPVLGVPFGTGLLIAALFRMNPTLQRAGLVVLLLSGIAAEAADFTGDGAKDVLRDTLGAQFPRAAVHEHEDSATWALSGAGALAVVAAATLWVTRRKAISRGVTIGFVAGGIVVTAIMLRTAHLGGLIRHPEIGGAAPTTPVSSLPPPARTSRHSHRADELIWRGDVA